MFIGYTMRTRIQTFFDPSSCTFSYVVFEGDGGSCAVIDPVLNFDTRAYRISSESAERIIQFIETHDLKVQWLLETHVHADHLSAAEFLKSRVGGRTGISESIIEAQRTFRKFFNLGPDFNADGSDFDHLFKADERFHIGALEARALYVPGHTPVDMAYYIANEAVFVGDTIFMSDVGTARCDFPGGDARTLYQSIQHLLALPPRTRLYFCHDYPPGNRPLKHQSSVSEQKAMNIHVNEDISCADFVTMRQKRDATLELPAAFMPAIQINLRAGKLPPTEQNGTSYLKIPIQLG